MTGNHAGMARALSQLDQAMLDRVEAAARRLARAARQAR